MGRYHVAIVGGGIGGLYAAYRLRQAWRTQRETLKDHFGIGDGGPLTVVILERNPIVLGGRIRIADLPFPGGSVRAELGPMRITTRHRLARRLFEQLGVRTVPFEGEGFTEHFYLRGKHFDHGDIELAEQHTFPYAVDKEEKGMSPGALVARVLEQTLTELSLDKDATPNTLLILEKLRSKTARGTLTHDEWCQIQEHGLLMGRVHLKNIGMWNLIHHYLSPEAAQFVEDGFGYESIIGNWNVSDAIPWFIADFSTSQEYEAIVGSFFDVVERIQTAITTAGEDFRCDVVRNAQVTSLGKSDDHYVVRVATKMPEYRLLGDVPDEITANAVFLALPRRPLEDLHIDWLSSDQKEQREKKEEWYRDLAAVRPHRLVKIVQGYRKAWWRQDHVARGAASRTFTDLPLRQVYYYDREWLEERGRYRDENGAPTSGGHPEIEGMIVAYLDGHYASFWRFITAVQRLHSSETTRPKEEQKRAWFGDRVWAWREPDLRDLDSKPLTQWTDRERELHLYFNRYGLYDRASAKVKHALEFLHRPVPGTHGVRVHVQEPVAGAYTFWDDYSDDALSGAGWHTWESGVNSEKVMERMARPFEGERVYVCGEAYSNEQGWIEGALKSVERVMDRLGILLPDETADIHATSRARDLSDAIRNHVGLPPRVAESPLPVKPIFSGHRSVAMGDSNDLVFLAGKIGFQAGDVTPRSLESEATGALEALLGELAKAGGVPSDLVAVRAFLHSMDDYDAFNRIYNEKFKDSANKAPVRTAIAAGGLPLGARVEVDGIAVVKRRS
ncbi:MAG TPA: Rid family hydrolase [Vicinamibacterales bacterium]|nr:Rid family hydrolase [Vicinamibacterales bacterium]